MKKLNLFLLAVLGATSLFAAKLEQVIVRQQWPWSTDVKIEYKLSGVTAPVDISVRAYNGDVELDQAKVVSALVGDRYGISEDGVGTIILDPVKAFGTEKVALANFKVKLSLSDSAANINEVIYKVFDLETGACTDIRRADFFDGKYGAYETDFGKVGPSFQTSLSDVLIWTGVTNDVAYKTTKLVMRKIPAKDVVWTMGAPVTEVGYTSASETNHLVKLKKDYYMSVFPVTRKQFFLATGKHALADDKIDSDTPDVCPENGLMYGNESAGDVCACMILPKLRTKLAERGFALPTDAQWEFACRAGTKSALYSGKEVSSDALWSGKDPNCDEIAWFAGNTTNKEMPVGGKAPNAFGLYDMIGNVAEWCCDKMTTGVDYVAVFGAGWEPDDVVVDQKAANGQPRVMRGLGIVSNGYAKYLRNAVRRQGTNDWSTPGREYGVRVIFTVED